ncbi:MAG: thioredoxin family protein [Vampirovibrio sp.]
MHKRFNFLKPSVLVLALLAFFWSSSLIKVFSEGYTRFPSSYDKEAKTPVQTRISQAKTDRLLIEFYQDNCRFCQIVAPFLHQVSQRKSFQQCLTVIPINTDLMENRLYMELFKIKSVPSFFIFEPKAMKKTPIVLNTLDHEKSLKDAIQRGLNTHDPSNRCRI